MANEVWVEVFSPDEQTMLGIVMLVSASVTKPLDAAGTFTLIAPTSEPNAVSLLQIFRRVLIYWQNAVHGKTLVGGGALLSPSLSINSAQTTWTGQSFMVDLRQINTWRGLEYNNEPFEDVIADLVSQVPGWSSLVDPGYGNTSRRYDGQSILRALTMAIQGKGAHMRTFYGARHRADPATPVKTVEVGAFGGNSGFRLTNLETASREARSNPELMIINTLSVVEDGFEIKNRVEPVWGSGDAVLTLKKSTRSSPYPILSQLGPDGRTMYYLEDTTSIGQYGVFEGVLSMTDAPYVAPDGGVSVINAADVLYDWAASRLEKIAQPKKVYQTTAIKLDATLRPGDKVRVTYKGDTYVKGVKVVWLDVDELFWVLSLTETYNMRGQSVSLQISNVDDPVQTAAGMIADSLILGETNSILQRLTSGQSRYSDDLSINPGAPDVLTFVVSEFTVAIGQTVLMMERPDPSRPDTISVAIDGIDRTSELGGPWFVGALDNDPVEVDIDDILDVGDVRGEHEIEVSCLLRAGVIVTTVEIVEISVTA